MIQWKLYITGMDMLDHFGKIIELVKAEGLGDRFFETAKEHLEAASALLDVSPVQVALFSLLFDSFGEDSVSITKIADTVKCSKIQILKYMSDIEILRQKRLIRAAKDSPFSSDHRSYPEYYVPMEVINAIRSNTEYRYTAYENLNLTDFFDCVENLFRAAKEDDIDLNTLNAEIDYLLSHNQNLAFAKKQKEYNLCENSLLILFIFCSALVNNDEELITANDLMGELRSILGYRRVRPIMRDFKLRKYKLFEKELIEFDCQDSIADSESYRLTQKAKDEFLAGLDLREKTKHNGREFIRSEKIPLKKLFFSEKMRNRICELTELLHEKNFSGIQKRLEEKGMRTGFACLFSGSPGTGKTETAFQIARETGRDIMLVDIAETKSKWFGESEKRIKAIFDRYRGIVKSGDKAPILLFNEADAVLSKRRELSQSRSGPDQTENAIQNIILHEMETLSGILIATTNMTVNLDKAFERRFLYKIEFEKPDMESKIMMWQNLIQSISGGDAERLASEFDFSGGQIENIARKSTISFILSGTVPDLTALENFCREELMEKTAAKIGFCA